MTTASFLTANLLFVLAACSKQPNAVVATTPARATAAPPAPAAAVTATPPAPQGHIGVSDDLVRRCTLRFDRTDEAPKFDYDRDELLPQDRSVLEQVAECLTRGPLRGRAVRLVGHADPRGTEEYNLGLGSRRAAAVAAYLKRLGVPAGQLAQTTRGDLDAAGTDEPGWRIDRRVDLALQ